MSLRIVPAAAHGASYSATAGNTSAPSAPGVHDTLRQGLNPAPLPSSSSSSAPAAAPVSRHPLEPRLLAWQQTQEALRQTALRRAFGVAEPVRRAMELQIVRGGDWRPAVLRAPAPGQAGPSLHEDILRGREAYLDWDDVFAAGDDLRDPVGVHDEMERKLRM
ncbi:proteasome maturation factor UMP1 [Durotheca rogersii]|uniref:proteasome maturation factor UMP1 n=1 Tax=Durotheca rogersii TaxID=419775 RepID=UPI00221FC4FA|nr:proteasome maturation factor UMP1 [Durotheca rogersii]KAI5861627.1 proteasome maturation factor UMP1 [Durotheca rogersii]